MRGERVVPGDAQSAVATMPGGPAVETKMAQVPGQLRRKTTGLPISRVAIVSTDAEETHRAHQVVSPRVDAAPYEQHVRIRPDTSIIFRGPGRQTQHLPTTVPASHEPTLSTPPTPATDRRLTQNATRLQTAFRGFRRHSDTHPLYPPTGQPRSLDPEAAIWRKRGRREQPDEPVKRDRPDKPVKDTGGRGDGGPRTPDAPPTPSDGEPYEHRDAAVRILGEESVGRIDDALDRTRKFTDLTQVPDPFPSRSTNTIDFSFLPDRLRKKLESAISWDHMDVSQSFPQFMRHTVATSYAVDTSYEKFRQHMDKSHDEFSEIAQSVDRKERRFTEELRQDTLPEISPTDLGEDINALVDIVVGIPTNGTYQQLKDAARKPLDGVRHRARDKGKPQFRNKIEEASYIERQQGRIRRIVISEKFISLESKLGHDLLKIAKKLAKDMGTETQYYDLWPAISDAQNALYTNAHWATLQGTTGEASDILAAERYVNAALTESIRLANELHAGIKGEPVIVEQLRRTREGGFAGALASLHRAEAVERAAEFGRDVTVVKDTLGGGRRLKDSSRQLKVPDLADAIHDIIVNERTRVRAFTQEEQGLIVAALLGRDNFARVRRTVETIQAETHTEAQEEAIGIQRRERSHIIRAIKELDLPVLAQTALEKLTNGENDAAMVKAVGPELFEIAKLVISDYSDSVQPSTQVPLQDNQDQDPQTTDAFMVLQTAQDIGEQLWYRVFREGEGDFVEVPTNLPFANIRDQIYTNMSDREKRIGADRFNWGRIETILDIIKDNGGNLYLSIKPLFNGSYVVATTTFEGRNVAIAEHPIIGNGTYMIVEGVAAGQWPEVTRERRKEARNDYGAIKVIHSKEEGHRERMFDRLADAIQP